ncbi:TetR/AcrR family transcriptional regulator [Limosilactobacillus mucosae]|uniref:TetR family transcriptional regulator n=2 Tax=Lactobacillales TaxID=186826 RepID=A0AAJ1HT23_LIMMU|nr:TetR family transcriptional regulator [Limosilactobacillus mucosae]MDC2830168.1 TetR family transcriptional regulator [Limosilactobacillus mucosae]MDC2853893.1 TetR family transcriptional regulator [Limosilactobacillus mucosae]MDD6864846.1 TetR family transcriptional regulator [Lactobacillus sp.]
MKNLQSQRTDKMIRDAFIALLKQKDFKNITVTQIAQKAMINRQTFYCYYSDKYDLADQLTEKALGMFEELIEQRWQSIHDRISLVDFLKISQKDQQPLFGQIISEERDLFLTMLNLQVDNQSLCKKCSKV